MRSLVAYVTIFSLIVLPACSSESTDTSVTAFDFEAASEIITQKTERFTESHITGDLDFLNNVFADDARVYPPGSDKIASLAEIATINAQYVEYGISVFTEVSTNRYGGPDFIMDEGTYTMTYEPENTSEAGYYINIWKRIDDDWKLFANIWTVMPSESE